MGKRSKPHARPKLKRPKQRHDIGIDRWVSSHRIVKIAFAAAVGRYGELPGVRGLGVGCKYHDSTGALAANRRLCVRVLVEYKRDPKVKAHRVPKWMFVVDPRTGKRRRVDLDVIEIGDEHELEMAAPDWPTIGRVKPGYRFAHEAPAPSTGQSLPHSGTLKGTAGAVIRWKQGGAIDGVSAAHVFLGSCGREASYGPHALGAKGRTWRGIDGGDLLPRRIDFSGLVRDTMMFPIPSGLRPQGSMWPEGFLKTFAQPQDFEQAVQQTGSVMMWVERQESQKPVPLMMSFVGLDYPLQLNLKHCGWTAYELVFRCKYDEDTSVKGDSGAPVFIRAAEDRTKWRLLGFHFFNDQKTFSCSMSAEHFFINEINATLGVHYEFL